MSIQVIELINGEKGAFIHDEDPADAGTAIIPGMLVERTATGVQEHSTAAGNSQCLFALPNLCTAGTIDTAYAIGEILLVVIGILMALQINNQNDLRKEREREIHYLENIKMDLGVTLLEMDKYIEVRTEGIAGANRIIEHFEGKPITDYSAFNADGVGIYDWQKFWQNNNTFQELVNSGNLALISNETIKKTLLDIELLHKKLKSEEDHYRYDSETVIYGPLYEVIDLGPMIANYEYRLTNGASGENVDLSGDYYSEFLKSTKLKNGFYLTILEFNKMNAQMVEIKQKTRELISLIDEEVLR